MNNVRQGKPETGSATIIQKKNEIEMEVFQGAKILLKCCRLLIMYKLCSKINYFDRIFA